MLDLSKKEREYLNKIGKKGKVYRQTNLFVLVKDNSRRILATDPCKSLIDKGALKEVQENDEAWIYMAEARLFAPNYIVEHNE